MLPIHTILHPTDFSRYSDSAFRVACMVARDCGARLVVVHVVPPPVFVYGEGVMLPDPEAFKAPARQQLSQLAAQDARISVEHRLMEGDPGAEIARAASDLHADLIVIGTHGRTGLGRLLMGSVAEQVMRKAPCPVLSVKSAPMPVEGEATDQRQQKQPAAAEK